MRTLAFAALLTSGCGALAFDVDQSLPEQTVQGNPLGGILPSFIPAPIPLMIDLRAETEKRGTGPAKHAFLKSLELTATPHAQPSGNFDFLDEVHIYVSARDNASLPRVEIATLKPVPKGATTVQFAIVPEVDLLPYINAGAQIDSQASGTQPRMDFTFDGVITITIKI